MDREKAILMERAKAIRELTLATEALREKHQLFGETSTISEKESVEGETESATTTATQKQVTGKLKNAEIATSEGEESTMGQPKSKLGSEQMREYIPKGEVLDIIKSMPMDLVEEYVYELDGIWIDEEEVDYCNNCPYISWDEGCISRQDVVEAIEGVDWYHVNSKGELVHGSTSDEESWYRAEDIYKAIESLPPVTPTVSEDCIDRDQFREQMYHRCFEVENDPNMQRWDSGNWIRYKLFSEELDKAPSVTPTEHKTTETMIVDGMEMEIDPVSYEVGYSHGQVATTERTAEE